MHRIVAIPFVVAALGLAAPALACPKADVASRTQSELVTAFAGVFAAESGCVMEAEVQAAATMDGCGCRMEDALAGPTCDLAETMVSAAPAARGAGHEVEAGGGGRRLRLPPRPDDHHGGAAAADLRRARERGALRGALSRSRAGGPRTDRCGPEVRGPTAADRRSADRPLRTGGPRSDRCGPEVRGPTGRLERHLHAQPDVRQVREARQRRACLAVEPGRRQLHLDASPCSHVTPPPASQPRPPGRRPPPRPRRAGRRPAGRPGRASGRPAARSGAGHPRSAR